MITKSFIPDKNIGESIIIYSMQPLVSFIHKKTGMLGRKVNKKLPRTAPGNWEVVKAQKDVPLKNSPWIIKKHIPNEWYPTFGLISEINNERGILVCSSEVFQKIKRIIAENGVRAIYFPVITFLIYNNKITPILLKKDKDDYDKICDRQSSGEILPNQEEQFIEAVKENLLLQRNGSS